MDLYLHLLFLSHLLPFLLLLNQLSFSVTLMPFICAILVLLLQALTLRMISLVGNCILRAMKNGSQPQWYLAVCHAERLLIKIQHVVNSSCHRGLGTIFRTLYDNLLGHRDKSWTESCSLNNQVPVKISQIGEVQDELICAMLRQLSVVSHWHYGCNDALGICRKLNLTSS